MDKVRYLLSPPTDKKQWAIQTGIGVAIGVVVLTGWYLAEQQFEQRQRLNQPPFTVIDGGVK